MSRHDDFHRFRDTRIKKLSLYSQPLNRVPEHRHPRGHLTRHDNYHSRILGYQRAIDLYLPPSYGLQPDKRYPVVYMHDGNNLFDPRIAYAGVPWQVDKTLNRLIAHNLVEEVIVVGVHNTMARHQEYTWHPMRWRHGVVEGGDGARYARFLIEELKPFIDSQYRTKILPQHTAVMGSSLGGLISLYLGIHHPHVFGRIGAISPSLWWGYGKIFKELQAMRISPTLKIWLDMGTREGNPRVKVEENPNLQATRLLKELLQQQGFVEGVNLGYLEDRGAMHNEHSWGERFHLPILFFFGTRPHLIRVRN